MARNKSRGGQGRGRGRGRAAPSSARNGLKAVPASTTVQHWAQVKQGISFKSNASARDEAPSAKASWIEVQVPSNQALNASCWGFRPTWTTDYRRDALWINIPISSTSMLGEALKDLPASRPIGFQATKKKAKSGEDTQRIAVTDVFPDTDAIWLSDLTALISADLVSIEIRNLNTSNGQRQNGSVQRERAMHIGIAWQQYMDKCLYKPAFAWPPTEVLHIQMQHVMLWALRASKEHPDQWSISDPEVIDRLFNEFVGDNSDGYQLGYEVQDLPPESPCVEFTRDGVSLGYDPFRACFLGLL